MTGASTENTLADALERIQTSFKVTLTTDQFTAVEDAYRERNAAENYRACLFFATGSGKTITSLSMVAAMGYVSVLVIAPPITHSTWVQEGSKLNIEVTAVSHAKFRQKGYKVSRHQPIIADEMHLFGGHGKLGFTKFQMVSRAIQAPIIMNSATPNYNDAERCYCIVSILDPQAYTGGYLNFIYSYCDTTYNPFSQYPHVTGFRNFSSAEAFLEAQPKVFRVRDLRTWAISDRPKNRVPHPVEYTTFGMDPRRERMIASAMEDRVFQTTWQLLTSDELLRPSVLNWLDSNSAFSFEGKTMVYSDKALYAEAAAHALRYLRGRPVVLITGKLSKKEKLKRLQEFLTSPDPMFLVCTSTITTGTDGLDKVCDTLLILNDTTDNALREQLVGRILPRGLTSSSAQNKRLIRLTFL